MLVKYMGKSYEIRTGLVRNRFNEIDHYDMLIMESGSVIEPGDCSFQIARGEINTALKNSGKFHLTIGELSQIKPFLK